MSLHEVKFVASGRGKARCPPDPRWPHGIALDGVPPLAGITETCTVQLPYPAPECGIFEIRCRACEMSVAVTAAGRPDDPLSVRIPCLITPPEPETGA